MRSAGVVSLWDALAIMGSTWAVSGALVAAEASRGGAARFTIACCVGLIVGAACLLSLWKLSSVSSRAFGRAPPTGTALTGFYAAPLLAGVLSGVVSFAATSRLLTALRP
jgi:hypothetical protein